MAPFAAAYAADDDAVGKYEAGDCDEGVEGSGERAYG